MHITYIKNHVIYLNFDFSAEYYTVQSISQDVVVIPDGVLPSVVLLVTLKLKVFYTVTLLHVYVILTI